MRPPRHQHTGPSALRLGPRAWPPRLGALIATAIAPAACLRPGPDRPVSAPPIQAEHLARAGGKSVAPSTSLMQDSAPFAGVLLYQNGEHVALEHDFPIVGRYRFEVRGASSDARPAGITVFVGGQAGGTAYFAGPRPEVAVLRVDVPAPGRQPVRLQLTTDVGDNDTLLDWLAIAYDGPLQPAPAPPEQGALRSGRYRNLLRERGYPDDAIARKLDAAWRQLFEGDPADETLFYPSGKNRHGPLAFLPDIGSDDVRSEGMSYGMMVAVQLDKKAAFDALWNWARSFMYHEDPRHPSHGYFSWSMNRDGTPRDEMPAPDGEEYFAMALYFASGRWGDGQGIYAYRAQADQILRSMRQRKPLTGSVRGAGGVRTATATALMHPEEKQIRFTPDTAYHRDDGDHTDPSYHLPAFYELWARWGPVEDRAFWREAATVSRELFVRAAHPRTGLVPDYAHFDGTPKARKSDPGSANFRFDAWRAIMNWSSDHAWWAADPRQRELSNRVLRFFAGRGLATHGNQFTLAGEQLGHDHSPGLVAMNAVGALAATDAIAWRFVDELWTQPIPRGRWRYYDGMLYLLGLLHVSGNFRVFPPAGADAEMPVAQRAAGE